MYQPLVLRIVRPHQLSDSLHAPDVQIRSFENMVDVTQLGEE